MHGLHLTAELYDCAPAPAASATLLVDADALQARCLQAVRRCGLTSVGTLFHSFASAAACRTGASAVRREAPPDTTPPAGVTGVVLLAESHLALHTWPELGTVTLDVYVCNRGADNSGRARQLLAELEVLFAPARVERRELSRGALDAPAAPD